MTHSAFGISHDSAALPTDVAKSVRGEEYNSSKPYEKYSAEKKRRRIGAEGAAYSGGSAVAGAGVAAGSAARIAGTKAGQGALTALHRDMTATNHPLAPQAAQAKKIGQFARANRGKTVAGIGAAAAASAGLGMAARFRRNEEQGISQGIGRLKAGNTYNKDQKKIVSKAKMTPLSMAAGLSDVNWEHPAIRGGLAFANKNKKKIAAGAAGTTAVVGGGSLAAATNNRKKARGELRRIS